MNNIVLFIVIAVVAILGANVLFRPVFRSLVASYALQTGFGYLFLGIILGPYVLNVLSSEVLQSLEPLMYLGIGWIGLFFGMQFNNRHLKVVPKLHRTAIFLESGVTWLVILCGLLSVFVLPGVTENGDLPWSFIVLMLASAGSISSPMAVAILRRDIGRHSFVIDVLRLITSMDGIFGIVVFGCTLCQFHFYLHDMSGHAVHAGWQLILSGTVLGVVLGWIFILFNKQRTNENEELLILIGFVVFISGIAQLLYLSPLFLNFICGISIANMGGSHERIYRQLHTLERPLFLLIIIFAGAFLEPIAWYFLPVFLLYLVFRVVGKLCGGVFAARLFKVRPASIFGLGYGLLPQNGITIAIALSIRSLYAGEYGTVIMVILVLGTVFNNLIGFLFMQRLISARV